jgi:predicted RNA binding protein YcfA (HicA-like mRNA interferase family)
MSGKQLDEAKQALGSRRASLRCGEITAVLEGLGFVVRSGKAGHKVYTHPGLKEFTASSFNCGHGKNPEVKSAYISNILRVLQAHDIALRAFLDGKNNDQCIRL